MTIHLGFITPPWPHERGDSVSVRSLIQRAEKEAHHGCGLHFEIYQYRVLDQLKSQLAVIDAADVATFIEVAASCGYHLDDSTIQGARQAYEKKLEEIRKDQK
ncbi:hypothetical protein CI266_004950 [Salmonella enterica subsp. enterica serovar Kotte]|nr:hypothetical protein [Salmonella enterica subsp. enterica serovar Kotte]